MEGTSSLPGKWAPVNISDYHLEALGACTLGVVNEIVVDGGIPKGKKKNSPNKEPSKNQNQIQI